MNDCILEGRNICKTFCGGFGGRAYTALREENICLRSGETLALMGPSGCGKSTLARILMRLIDPDSGQVFFRGEDITHTRGKKLRHFRKSVQLISQRPETFFDPRMRLGDSLLEPLKIFGITEEKHRVPELLERVKLTDDLLSRYPHQVSGGEIQRLSLCRALLLSSEILVLDEPTSMLDVSVQAQILQILKAMQAEYGLSYLFITHDHEVARYMSDRIQYMK
ncbi:MAG: ABC transporter ATP-binding protein [Clostridia bacterium]|nr:ABC transporter ATP-binding protein [Clostridia bacterium]